MKIQRPLIVKLNFIGFFLSAFTAIFIKLDAIVPLIMFSTLLIIERINDLEINIKK